MFSERIFLDIFGDNAWFVYYSGFNYSAGFNVYI